jgi:hypothetical protein
VVVAVPDLVGAEGDDAAAVVVAGALVPDGLLPDVVGAVADVEEVVEAGLADVSADTLLGVAVLGCACAVAGRAARKTPVARATLAEVTVIRKRPVVVGTCIRGGLRGKRAVGSGRRHVAGPS